jgi:hypothetical protein
MTPVGIGGHEGTCAVPAEGAGTSIGGSPQGAHLVVSSMTILQDTCTSPHLCALSVQNGYPRLAPHSAI